MHSQASSVASAAVPLREYDVVLNESYRLSAATGLDQGDRERQEDQLALLAHPRVNDCMMGVVADGMGGRTGGRMGSAQAVMIARRLFEGYRPGVDDPMALLRRIGLQAHMMIRQTGIATEEEPHSTIAVFVITPDGACHWMHSGDSRIYHFHGDTLVKRTRDHSYVQMLVDSGELTEAEAAAHPQSNVLMSCLGTEREPDFDVHSIPCLQPGDTLLACSDGLWRYFDADELGMVVSALPPSDASQILVRQARHRAMGEADNLSLIIVRLDPLQ